ncbi:MAG: topoisomerase IV, partial [Clostridia bacterium]|nr:topoisomerase IV [Clostridia bacterium]
TKNNRKKLLNAYSDRSPLVAVRYVPKDAEYVIQTSNGRYVLFNSAAIASKSARDTLGVAVVTLKKGHRVMSVEDYTDGMFANPSRYRTKNLPSKGAILSADDLGEQQISLE